MAIQHVLGIKEDGSKGPHTTDVEYRFIVENVKTPYALKTYGQLMVIGDPDKTYPVKSEGRSLKYFKNAVNGGFSWAGEAISILVRDHIVLRRYSAHQFMNKPDSVLCYYDNGMFQVHEVVDAHDIPNFKHLIWAIGGAGMGRHYNPTVQGFENHWYNGNYYKFADVYRRTTHTVIGYDKFGYVIAVCFKNKDRKQMENHMENNLGIYDYVLLDGSSKFGYNIDDYRYRDSLRRLCT